MSDAVLQFLLANLALSGGILMVFALRKPVRAQFGARLGYALWLLPLLAAAASFLPPRVVDIVAPAVAPVFEPMAPAIVTAAPGVTVAALPEPVAASVVTIDPWVVGSLIWIAGMIAMAAWLAAVQMRFMAGVKRGVAGPAVVGFLRPRIVTPADFEMRYDPGERRVILAHETIHLDRNDARINALAALIRCVCWFNPLVHVAAHFLRIDQEMACDAAVVERHPKARKLYADALLKTQLAAHPLPLGCYWPAGTEHPLMERIEMLKRSGPGVARRTAGLAVLAFIAIGASCTTWAAKPAETRIVEAPAPQDELRLLAPPSVQMPASFSINFNGNDPVIVRGKVIRFERDYDLTGSPRAAVWIEADRITATGGDWPSDSRTKVWRVVAGSPGRWPDWADARIVGQDVIARGYRGFDKTCKPACLASSPDWTFPKLPALQPFADVTWTRDSDDAQPEPQQSSAPDRAPAPVTAGQPLRIVAVKRGLLEVRSAQGDKYVRRFFEPGEGYPPRVGYGWTVSADDGSAFEWRLGDQSLGLLAPSGEPVQFQSVDLVLADLEQFAPAPQSRPTDTISAGFDANDPIHLLGKVEKIEFGATTYVAFVRAASIAACPQGPETANTALWELAPTPYWGDRDAVVKDLMNASVYVRGFNAKDKSCAQNCRMLARGVFKSRNALSVSAASISTFTDRALNCPPAPQPARYEPQPQPQTPPAVPAVYGEPSLFEIRADRGRYDEPSKTAIYEGDVEIHFDGGLFTTDRLVVEDGAAPARASSPVLLPRVSIGAPSPIKVNADRSDQDPQSGTVVYSGNVELRGANVLLKADRLTLELVEALTPISAPEPQKLPAPDGQPAKKPSAETGDAVEGPSKNSSEEEVIEKKKSEAEGAELKRQAMKSKAEVEQSQRERRLLMESKTAEALRGGRLKLQESETPKGQALMDKLRGSGIAAAEAKRLKDRAAAAQPLKEKVRTEELERLDKERITAAEAKRLKDRATAPKQAPSKPLEPTSPPAAPSIPLPQPTSAPQTPPAPPGPSIPFAKYFDADAPIMLKGRVTAIDIFEGHAMLRVEEIQTTTPGFFSFPKPDVTKNWRVVLGRLDTAPAWARDPTLVGKVVEIRGYRGKEKDCGADCMMSGRDVILSGERLQGWAVPQRPKPPPPQLKPI